MEKFKNGQDNETVHSKIYKNKSLDQSLLAIDNPDDRITKQTGDGTTLIKNDNPDDLEDKLVK